MKHERLFNLEETNALLPYLEHSEKEIASLLSPVRGFSGRRPIGERTGKPHCQHEPA